MPICCQFGILNTDLSLLIQIHFSSDQQLGDTLIDLSKSDLHPFRHIPKWILIDNRKHKNNSINSSKKALRHINISFLPSCIPNLQSNLIPLRFNLLDLIVYPDSRGHAMGKCLRTITIYYTGLTHTRITYNDYFKWGH